MNKPAGKKNWVRGGAGLKRAYGRLAIRQLTRSAHPSVRSHRQDFAGNRHCFVLHGWSLNEHGVGGMTSALREIAVEADVNFWSITYDTQWTRFTDSAHYIAEAMLKSGHDFSNTILIGYSMGGIVARQMVANGFPCRALITICSPHHGPVPWLPPFGRGPRSIAAWSPALHALNKNPVDKAHRNHYHFFAVDYEDRLGKHAHDGIVPLRSALGMGLGDIAQRETVHLDYRSVATYDPHWRGKDPRYMKPVLPTVKTLFGALE